MSALSRDDVAHLAGLARIDLSDAELDRMVGELGVILESVAKVQQAPTDGVEPMSHPMPLTNVTRPDVVRPRLGAEAALVGRARAGAAALLRAAHPRRGLSRPRAAPCRRRARRRVRARTRDQTTGPATDVNSPT